MLSAKEIAEKYSGQTIKCKPISTVKVCDAAGVVLESFDAIIIGWKRKMQGAEAEYVCVEVLPPAVTPFLLSTFNFGYTYTANCNKSGFGKKVLPEEIILTGVKKHIPEWPHQCRDCGSPALILGNSIDCSNSACKNKYKTHFGLDLFLPVAQRNPGWDKDPNRKRRPGVNDQDYVLCPMCGNNAVVAKIQSKVVEHKMICGAGHAWNFILEPGDRVKSRNKKPDLIYRGGNVFVPSKD